MGICKDFGPQAPCGRAATFRKRYKLHGYHRWLTR